MKRKQERHNGPVVESVITKLRAIRHARGISQKEVFTATDINIGRIEAGRGNISISTLADLCAYYKISLKEFFGASETPPSPAE